MTDKTTSIGSLNITVAGDGSANAFIQDGGTVNLNGTTDISGQNTYGMQLVGTNLTAAGEVTISDSTVSSFSATDMANKTINFGKLTITQAGGATGEAFFQSGGSLIVDGIMNLSVIGGGESAGTAFYTTGLSDIILNNVNIGVGTAEKPAGYFANGINITGSAGQATLLSKAGAITIKNIAANGTAINFDRVAMDTSNANC